MRWLLTLLIFFAFNTRANENKEGIIRYSKLVVEEEAEDKLFEELRLIMVNRKSASFSLGTTKKGRPIKAYFFPGTGDKNALVLGGVHGSELSSIEVARSLVSKLSRGPSPYYNVLVVPELFPDNAAVAKEFANQIGSELNIGRYSWAGATDPNRQMPGPGKCQHDDPPIDEKGRIIEYENLLLFKLIQEFRPDRIASIHAIRNTGYAGFFADPRTDEKGKALGFETDSSLAVSMASFAKNQGGFVPGNLVNGKHNAVYHKDPVPAPMGAIQKRNFQGSPTKGFHGNGVSLGSWATTAINDDAIPSHNRSALRVVTIEFPGSKRPEDHLSLKQQRWSMKQVNAFALAIQHIFLRPYFTED